MRLDYIKDLLAQESVSNKVYLVNGSSVIRLAESYTIIGARERAITQLESLITQLENDNVADRKVRDEAKRA